MDPTYGGLGGLGGMLNSAAMNPYILAGLQMIGNNTPQIGRIPNPMTGVPQLLLGAGTAAYNRGETQKAQAQSEALFNSLLGNNGNNGGNVGTVAAPSAPTTPDQSTTDTGTSDYAGGQDHFSDTFNQVKSTDPNTLASNFRDLGNDYGGLSIASAADKLSETNKTSAARLLNTAKKLGLSPDTRLSDQLMEDPKVGPEMMKAFMGQNYQKVTPEQWAQAHGAWNDARNPQQQTQQQPGPFDTAPSGTAEQAPGTVVVGPTPAQRAATQGGLVLPTEQQFQQMRDEQARRQGQANAGGPAYNPPPNVTMNQMPAGPTPQQQAVSQQAQRIMSPASAAPGAAPQAAPAQAAPGGVPQAGGQFSLAGANPRMLSAVLANPNTSPQVKAALLQRMNPQLHFQAVTDSWGNQSIVAMDPYTGQIVNAGINKGGPGSGGGVGATPGLQQIAQQVEAARQSGVTDTGKLADLIPDKATAEYTKAILRGDAIPAYLGNRAGPLRANAIAMAHVIDPGFSEDQITARMAFARQMNSTAQNSWGSQVRSSQTILEHTDQALNALPRVMKGASNIPGGAYGDIAVFNRMRALANANSKDKDYLEAKGAYDAAVEVVAKEKVRLLTGSEGTKEERMAEADKLDFTKHPASEVLGAWKATYNIMRGRLTPVALQKQEAFGKPVDPDSLLPASAQKTIEKLRGLGTGTVPLEGAATGQSVQKWERGPDGVPRPVRQQ